VKERATSFGEQLVRERERERRWRKVLEDLQRVALFLLWQRSLAVGMLRDWRALNCFGSSVEGEEEDRDGVVGVGVGVVGVGEEVGEEVGEREIVLLLLLVATVERRRRRRMRVMLMLMMLLLLQFCWFSVNSTEGEADLWERYKRERDVREQKIYGVKQQVGFNFLLV
jgi:hypothetical protein